MRRGVVLFSVVAVVTACWSGTARSQTAIPVPGVPPSVELIGDSLSLDAEGLLPESWRVRAVDGRPLYRVVALVRSVAATDPPVLVLALGSNDVNQERSRSQMSNTLEQVEAATGDLPVVVVTTVKVKGVSAFYGRHWSLYASTWNGLVTAAGLRTGDWNVEQRSHGSWFLNDGLHMNSSGQQAYADFLVRSVEDAVSP